MALAACPGTVLPAALSASSSRTAAGVRRDASTCRRPVWPGSATAERGRGQLAALRGAGGARLRPAGAGGGRGPLLRVAAQAKPGDAPELSAAKYWEILKRRPWTARPETYDDFLNVQTAGVVSQTTLGADGRVKAVDAAAVRRPVLNIPPNDHEWHERLQCNVLRFRQNYGLLAICCLLGYAFRASLALGGSVTLALLGVAVGHNDLLLELSAWAGEATGRPQALPYTADRVMGVSRALLGQLMGCCSVLLFWAAAAHRPHRVAAALLQPWGAAALAMLVHASVRPVDIKSTLANLMTNLGAAASSQEVTDTLRRAGGAAMDLLKRTLDKPMEGIPFVNVTVQEKGPSGGAAARPATDAEARPARPALPPPEKQGPKFPWT